MAGGAAVGGATMAFKNYGDMSKDDRQKQEEIAVGAGLGAVINGIVAALTKGKIKQVIHPEAGDDEAKRVLEAIRSDPEAFGLKKEDGQKIAEAIDNPPKKAVEAPVAGAFALESKYLNKKSDRVLENELFKEAVELPKPIESYQDFKNGFNFDYESRYYYVDTPVGQVRANPSKTFAHLTHNTHFQDRSFISGAFFETLKDPLFVVKKPYKNDWNIVFYKPFKDEKGRYHLASFAVDKNGEVIHKTFFEMDNLSKLKELIKVPDNNLLYYKHSNQPAKSPDYTSHSHGVEKSAYSDEIISQKSNLFDASMEGNFFTNGGVNLGTGFVAGTANAADMMLEGGSDEEIADSFVKGLLAGAVGVEGLRLLKKTNPKAFEKVKNFVAKNYNPDGTPKDEAAIGAFLSKMEKKEKRGIYNVTFNDKKSTVIRKDLEDVENALKYEKGFENPRTKKGFGALHIQKHLDRTKDGWVTEEELLEIGDIIRNSDRVFERDGKRIYEKVKNGIRFRAVIGDRPNGERVITFYSNRKSSGGIDNDSLTYNYSTTGYGGSHDAHRQYESSARDGNEPPHYFNRTEPENIIPQDNDGVQIGAFIGDTPGGGGIDFEAFEKFAVKEPEILNEGRVIADFVRGAASPALAPRRAGQTAPEAGNPLKNIIPQDNDGVQIGAFFGKAPKSAPGEPKEFAPHLKKIVQERINKEWEDISRSLKGELKRIFTNTFSGEYLDRRDRLFEAKNEIAQKATRLHNALKELPKEHRELLHDYIV